MGISSYNLIKKYLSTTNEFDVICLSEMHVTSYTPLYQERLVIEDYNLIRADHSCNTKPGGVCMYHKEALHLKLQNINYFNKYICSEAVISNKSCDFISFYRVPSQSCDKFEKLISNLYLTPENLAQIYFKQSLLETLMLHINDGMNGDATIGQQQKELNFTT